MQHISTAHVDNIRVHTKARASGGLPYTTAPQGRPGASRRHGLSPRLPEPVPPSPPPPQRAGRYREI